MNSSKSPESQDLKQSLETADISQISSIHFFPEGEKEFVLKTDNIKRIALYISQKLGKTEFNPGELHSAFEYVKKNLDTTISETEFDSISEQLKVFVEKGGEILIAQKNPEESSSGNLFKIASSGFIIFFGMFATACGGFWEISFIDSLFPGIIPNKVPYWLPVKDIGLFLMPIISILVGGAIIYVGAGGRRGISTLSIATKIAILMLFVLAGLFQIFIALMLGGI